MGFCYILLLLLVPSQSSQSYQRYNLDKLCQERSFGYTDILYHREPTNVIELNDSPSMSAALIEHAWDNSTYKLFKNCEFMVKTPMKWFYGSYGSTSGLYLAIRELNFRKNAVDECLDYVIFELSGIHPASHKICGNISDEDGPHDAKTYFEIPDGYIKIIIHLDKHVLGSNEIKMKLTVTAFDDCSGSYKFRCKNYRCISQNLYDDAIINCIPPLCADEPSLFRKCGAKPTYISTNIHIMAVGSSLFFVVFCIAMCYHFVKLLLARCGARRIDDHVPPIVVYQSVPTPSAPDDTLSELQISTDDPPSYESLYS